jgi:hypothetical protein
MPVLGDPTFLENLASRYERDADSVRTSGHRLTHAAGSADWQCQAADRFRAGAHDSSAQAESLAEQMCSMAQQLRSFAAQQRQEINELMAIESRVRQLLANPQPAANAPWAGTPWNPGNLPPSCDQTWRTVGRAFGF